MAVPVWATNQVLLASDVNTWFVPIAAYKSASLSRTSITLTVDPDLSISVAANSVYEIESFLNYQNVGGTAAFDWQFNVPSGAGGSWAAMYPQPGPVVNTWGNGWGVLAKAAASDNLSHGTVIGGTLITVSAGTFSVSWAPDAASGTMIMGGGSRITARRIS
jgi:hypothetical protein